MRPDGAGRRPPDCGRGHSRARCAGLGRRIGPEGGGARAGLAARLAGDAADWLLSVANLDLLPANVLALPRLGAVNFHDGPLPAYAGLNAPLWAILNGETRHGITWHLIGQGVDDGDILEQRLFDLAPEETTLSANQKCFAAAADSFPALLENLAAGLPRRQPQDMRARSYFGRAALPTGAGLINPADPVAQVLRLSRALDHGDYRNPVASLKVMLPQGLAVAARAESAPGTGQRALSLPPGPRG